MNFVQINTGDVLVCDTSCSSNKTNNNANRMQPKFHLFWHMRKNSEHKATKTSKDRKDRHQDVIPSKMKIGKKSNFNIFPQFGKGLRIYFPSPPPAHFRSGRIPYSECKSHAHARKIEKTPLKKIKIVKIIGTDWYLYRSLIQWHSCV